MADYYILEVEYYHTLKDICKEGGKSSNFAIGNYIQRNLPRMIKKVSFNEEKKELEYVLSDDKDLLVQSV